MTLTRNSDDMANETTRTAPAYSVADFYRSSPVLDRRIHIMGVGNVGSFIAHALRGIPNPPPVTLIFTKWNKFKDWEESLQRLTLVTDGDSEIRDGYEAEIAIPRIRSHGKEIPIENAADAQNTPQKALDRESTGPIRSLIICSKAPYVVSALSSVKHRLDKDSVILFLQNGMGIAEEVSREIFPDPATRPHYMLGINSHGLNNSLVGAFTTTHAGFGTILLGIIPQERYRNSDAPYEPSLKFSPTKDAGPRASSQTIQPDQLNLEYRPPSTTNFYWTPNERYLLRTLLRAPKLVVNCIINPLTVLLDARNGAILYNYAISRTKRLLLAEISLVIRSLPELQYIPNIETRFDPGHLETLVVGIANRTKDNISSMLADAREGRHTEIEYINGWIIRRVKGKVSMIRKEFRDGVPFVDDGKYNNDSDLEVKEGVAEGKDNSDGDLRVKTEEVEGKGEA
ncbi:ketopantoate reductase PanE/ApbA C terminal-domain-containing protein [Phaeosphaeriaceae sp. PMI808]|nr:ketopantoate reductase PanE/ApbA C terminal-domain-containing protein [Phaeosphaeriaceae sp. PMI808]